MYTQAGKNRLLHVHIQRPFPFISDHLSQQSARTTFGDHYHLFPAEVDDGHGAGFHGAQHAAVVRLERDVAAGPRENGVVDGHVDEAAVAVIDTPAVLDDPAEVPVTEPQPESVCLYVRPK